MTGSAPRGVVSRAPLRLPDGGVAVLRLEINPRARRIALRIDPRTGEAVAVAPSRRACPRAEAFARERAAWIAAALARLPRPTPFAHGVDIPLRGKAIQLRHEPGRATPRLEGGVLIAGGHDAAAFAARVRRYLIAQARADLTQAVARHAATLGVQPARIMVKDTRSRWGSCAPNGTLSFSWRIILAPPEALDYLAAHEVAHLLEMNHGPRFWAAVARCAPGYAAPRAWLRRRGAALQAVGVDAPGVVGTPAARLSPG